MKITEPSWSKISDKLNQEALDSPQSGDYWQENLSPYFLVVNVNDKKFTILDTKDRIDHLDNWEFDYSKSKIVDREWIRKYVMYSFAEGFVADVIRGDKFMKIAEEWKQFRRDQLLKEIEELK